MADSFTARGGLWVAGQSLLMIGVIALGLLFRGQWHNRASIVVGAGLFVLGGMMGIAGVRALGGNRTAYPKPMEGATLVQHGIFGLVRHPLYSSVILVSFAWGLLWQSGPALGAAAVLTIFLNRKASREERWLREKYPEYERYAAQVRRLIPGIY
ncbi:MAG TPA: isoprenylcysteine carboxylmethyltransferase family protein [Methylomirabilota bacterium]|nr:isoprenylcysteine carboxylmethyltransferase family protein [Methylomirabilota bacterium]